MPIGAGEPEEPAAGLRFLALVFLATLALARGAISAGADVDGEPTAPGFWPGDWGLVESPCARADPTSSADVASTTADIFTLFISVS